MLDNPIVTFLSDFGTREYYVGSVKGVLLSTNPHCRIVDISHDVGSHDILECAFMLRSAYTYFPSRTVHLVVVDPGVGSARRPILVCTENHYFVGPDNGVFSFVYERESVLRVLHITSEHYFLRPISRTFHARDIFAPVAGWLSRGLEPEKFGDPITDFVKFSAPRVRSGGDKTLVGFVLHIDKFGNLITNVTPADIASKGASSIVKIRLGPKEITSVAECYADGKQGEVFGILGSAGYYEISTSKASAAKLLGVQRGNEVTFELK